ncbi:type VII secretion protein EssC [Bombiscardovia nodaiensis]|uniref:Type VII secretion protein EssC n=1 Tax=Bombiscardovia nodaiensis TaxID=2932181 RepID=A0ABM8B7J8_9BIFI|nr:type VII secretion protein EssC [Bombiscardovia nodaiensis]
MLLTMLNEGRIATLSLPDKPAGMHWIESSDGGSHRRYAFVEAREGEWVLSPVKGVHMSDQGGQSIGQATLSTDGDCSFELTDGSSGLSLIARSGGRGDTSFHIAGFSTDAVVTIGRSSESTFSYDSPYVSDAHAQLTFAHQEFAIMDLGSSNGSFVNGHRIAPQTSCELSPGDCIEVLGLIITIGNRFISYNEPQGLTVHSEGIFQAYREPEPEADQESLDTADGGDEADYFYPAPRFKKSVEPFAVTVDPPPEAHEPDKTSVAMKIGPSLVMVLGAIASGAFMLMQSQRSGGSLVSSMPMMVMAASMIVGSVLWPVLSTRIENRQMLVDNRIRRQRYAEYLDQIRKQIATEAAQQKTILEENRITTEDCAHRVLQHDPRMMDRTSAHDDFLELRLGLGTMPMAADITYPDEHFSIEKDDLSQVVYQLAREPKDIVDAPISVNMRKHQIVGLSGPLEETRTFLDGLVVQIASLHSYEDVKLVLLHDEQDSEQWSWARSLPHLFTNDKQGRFLATNLSAASELGLQLGRIVEERRGQEGQNAKVALPHFVIICSSKELMDKADFIQDLARNPVDGFTLVCQSVERKDLPKQCTAIIELGKGQGKLFDVDDVSGRGQEFVADAYADEATCVSFSHALATVHLDLAASTSSLPDTLSFLDMYEAGNVEQLNVRARWQEAKAAETLAARVGVTPQGEPFYLNLHESFHGPHGLIAGTTGSGKSEFIITWILSMCIEFSPEEAAFVLIDYKGGGLAGAFDNSRGKLPHLAGTITNLDGSAIKRSMVSIQSELKRRQALFNEAREVAGGDNVDIYRYLQLYREGKVHEACPHLFIVADEFAELKAQEPDFMNELISAARIGRSLGVHLVLATQKPSGVVNEQIWSNSKFKISLKVSDEADSKELLKRPDAAELTQAGRFYMLVGYNELFALGQAAYAGGKYTPKAQYAPAVDNAVVLVSDTGRALSSAKARPSVTLTDLTVSELVAVLQHIHDVAAKEHLQARQLWLDPVPALLKVEELRQKADESAPARAFELNPIVGVVDDPARQQQHILTLPLSQEGNAIFYGGPDSGVESVLAAILFDLVRTHCAKDCNIYALDFGSETLKAFLPAPQMGDVACAGEDEKMARLLHMLVQQMVDRRRKLSSYGGSYSRYVVEHDDMPSVLLLVNGIAVFEELYESLEQQLLQISRDGLRVGIYVVLVAGSPNDVHMRLKTNFKQNFACGLSDRSAYMDVFGSMHNMVPPSGYARGLVKFGEELFVFQGAQILGRDADEFTYASEQCQQLAAESTSGGAQDVQLMPDVVDAQYLQGRSTPAVPVPFGVYEDNLQLAGFDFDSNLINRVVTTNPRELRMFVESLLPFAAAHWDCQLSFIDAAHLCEQLPSCCEYQTADDTEALDWFSALGARKADLTRQQLVVVTGISLLMARGASNSVEAFKNLLRDLRRQDKICFLLVDTANDVLYNSEDWFARQSSDHSGLWLGMGADTQVKLVTVYGLGEKIDPKAKAPYGYLITEGAPRKVKVLMDTTQDLQE